MLGLLASFTWATDFSQMSTEDMMKMRGSVPIDDRPDFQNEMQKRMQSMSPEERQKYMNTRGMGQGQGMMAGGQKCMNSLPTFEQYDLNNDGKIIESELEEARAKRMSQKAEEGKMLRNAKNAPAFADMDKNKDKSLDKEEFTLHQAEQMEKWNKRHCADKCKGMGHGTGMMKNASKMPTFADIDTNNDGTISKEEFAAHQTQRMQNMGKCAASSPETNNSK